MMKNYLSVFTLTILVALTGCKKDNNNGGGDDGKIEILVCMHNDAIGEDGNYCIVGMLPDGSQKRYLYRGSELIRPKQGSIGSDGETLLMSCNNDSGVRTYNFRTQTLTLLTDPGDYEVPVFSPDMKKVYVLYDDKSTFIAIDVATKSVTELYDAEVLIYPSFKNDGETLIVDYKWNESIASVKKDGTNLTMLKEGADETWYKHPLFVPALNKVVYVKSSNGSHRICLMNADGSGEVELTPGDVSYNFPSISSDGKKLAFGNDAKREVFVTALNGNSIGTPQAISEPEDRIWRPHFNRIDKKLFESLPEFVRPQEQ